MEGYLTIPSTVIADQVIDKSRFFAHVTKVVSSEEVEKHMRDVREKYPNARHYVYAYRLQEGRLERASDDGEPQGTGGRPVLDLLQHRNLWDVQIIVVRYFGGILLGTGGLTRAYGGTARLAVDSIEPTMLVPNALYKLEIPYSWYEQIKYQFHKKKWEIENEQFQEKVSLNLYIPEENIKNFEIWVNEFANMQIAWKKEKMLLRPSKGAS
ncbi:MAG: YigZ family protein [Eubacteriales bacterium]